MAISTAPSAAAPSGVQDRSFFGHPRGLSTLFFTEMWERFSYYGMRAILILFMTAPIAAGGLGFDVAKAGVIYGTYTALVYMLSLPGGWLADRFLGQRRATLYGGVVIMLGHISLAIPTMVSFYTGLALVVVGTGLLKPNVSTMVGQLYATEDARRDAGFSIFYMGINTGAFLAPLACGWLAQSQEFKGILSAAGIAPESSWHWGFAMAAVGMFLGLVQYLAGWKHLGTAGLEPVRPETERARIRQKALLQIGLALVIGLGALLALLSMTGMLYVSAEGIGKAFGVVLLLITVAFFLWMFTVAKWTPAERKRLIVVLVLFLAAAVFWSVFEQQGSTLNLFAERNTNTTIFGYRFPASWFQSLNALFIITLAPVFAWLWIRLGSKDPPELVKFTAGLVLAGLGFGVLILAAEAAESGVRVSPVWLAVVYLLHTAGELCLSPVGMSAVTKLAPARIAGLTMGVWFLALSVGNYLGGRVAGLYEGFALPELFGAVAAYALLAAIVLALLIKPVRRMLATSS
ncbi:MAG TPA: peptide MFS transporter [Gemmatimonadales bacterium]|nr:peptide MFS transporter [Gemmatimonadales bacterium]